MVETYTLTNSSLSDLKKCPRKYYYGYVLGIMKERKSSPLRLGGNVHLGLDLLAGGASLEDMCRAIRAEYAELPEWAMNDSKAEQDWWAEQEIALRLLCAYSWYWSNDTAVVVETETEFNLPLINPETNCASTRARLRGKIDKIVQLASREFIVREHKTTGDPIAADSDYWKRLRLDSQCSMYLYAARAQERAVAHVEYDVIHKPSIRPKSPTHGLKVKEKSELIGLGSYYGETFDLGEVKDAVKDKRESPGMYGARLSAEIVADPSKYFARREVPRLQSDIDEFCAELWAEHQIILIRRKNDSWSRNTDACLHPYRCEFRDICFQGFEPTKDNIPEGYCKKERLHMELGEE